MINHVVFEWSINASLEAYTPCSIILQEGPTVQRHVVKLSFWSTNDTQFLVDRPSWFCVGCTRPSIICQILSCLLLSCNIGKWGNKIGAHVGPFWAPFEDPHRAPPKSRLFTTPFSFKEAGLKSGSIIVACSVFCISSSLSDRSTSNHSVGNVSRKQGIQCPACMWMKLHGPGVTFKSFFRCIIHKRVFKQCNCQKVHLFDLHGPMQNYVTNIFLPWDKVQRLGEATNPGPEPFTNENEQVRFSLVNPTGLFKKDDLIAALGPGTYSIAETHATVKAQRNLRKAFRARLINPVFGKPVPSHLGNDTCKGVASGVACLSSFPCRAIPMNGFEDIFDTCRFVAAHVNLGPNLTCLIITIYAPPRSSLTVHDPKGLTQQLLECAFQMVQTWKGPAIITGDFNQDIFQMDVVQNLINYGWEDGQTLHHRRYGTPIKPTCVLPQGVSCFSNILCNPAIIKSFNWCTTTDHSFSGHPVLTLSCNIPILKQQIVVWRLPKPLECHSFDKETMEVCQKVHASKIDQIQDSLLKGEVSEAAAIWAQTAERTLAYAARDSNNQAVQFTSAHFQRHKGPKFQTIPVSQPIAKWGRCGDQQTANLQGPVCHRQHLRQLRRLQTMVNLSKARDREPQEGNRHACQELMSKIINAPVFKGGFPVWVVLNFHIAWPLDCPDTQFLEKIYECFLEYFHKIDKMITKETRQHTKEVFQKDWDKGGELSFKAIKEESVQPLCFVAKTVTATVRRTRWHKQGLSVLTVDAPYNLQHDLPVIFQGQQRNILAITSNTITVDKPLQLRSRNFVLKQVQYIYQPQEAGAEVVNAWNGFLQRDHPDDQWESAEEILPKIPSGPLIEMPDFDIELWRRVQAKTPVKSARGSCGFMVREIRNIPTWLLLILFNIFRKIEDVGTWPQSWVFAFTVLLPKTDNPSNAMDLRPITILSRIYRQWSRYRAIAIISGLTKLVPNTVAGGTSNMSALLLSGHFQDMLEDEDNLKSLCGLTIDIVKCYNTIPRFPLALFMMKLGWPIRAVKAYMAALFQMRRSFLVLNSASKWQHATTGIPEGCALAVASMLTVSVVVFHFGKYYSPSADVMTFADNWSFIFENFQQATYIINRLEEFCTALRLRLSIPKSWTWALDKQVAQQLSSVCMQGEPIPNHSQVTDLGVDLTYKGRRTKKSLYHRITLGLKRCQAVARVGGDKFRKPRLVLGSCFPKSSYGCALLHPPKNKFAAFRTETAKALGFSKTGASPWVALNLLPKQCDFEFHVVTSTLTFWRQYSKIFPTRKTPMLMKVCNPKTRGPSEALRVVLQKIGDINEDGHLVTQNFGRIDWTTCSKKYLRYVIDQQWNQYVCKHLQHRNHFTAEQTDSSALQKYCKTLSSPDFYGLSVHLTGAHYTHDLKSKFLDEENICPLCKHSTDSRSHRTLECNELEHLRANWTEQTRLIARENITAHLGLLEMPAELARIRLSIPIQGVFPDIPMPVTDLTILSVFVDGTCFHPQSQLTALAAGAAIVVTENPNRKVLHVQRALLPTRDHNSHRAEIYALLLGLRLGNALRIYSDCQSVIETYQNLATAVENHSRLPDVDNWDLWVHVVELMQNRTSHITLIKTKGHDCMDGDTVKHWQAWANNEVDKHAKAAILEDRPDLLAKFNRVVQVLQGRHRAHLQILNFHVAAARLVFKTNSITSIPTKVNGDRPSEISHHHIPPIPDGIVERCPINKVFVERLVTWSSGLGWEVQQSGETSFLELCLDFIFTTGTYPPLPIPKFENRVQSNKQWILLDQTSGPYDSTVFTLDQAIQGLSRAVNWLYKQGGISVFPNQTKNQTVSLKRFGYRGHPAGIPRRAKLLKPDEIDQWCHKNLCGQQTFKFPLPTVQT